VTGDGEERLSRARDPMLIPGVYNYCLRRCGRCPFTGRCLLYREDQAEPGGRDGELAETVGAELQGTVDLVRVLREREGLGSGPICGKSPSDAVVAAEERSDRAPAAAMEHEPLKAAAGSPRDRKALYLVARNEGTAASVVEERFIAAGSATERDRLYAAATDYESAAYQVVDPLRHLSPFHDWSRDVDEALDTISWNAGAIRTKLDRALWGQARRGDDGDEDPVQNDWNGSAKVARLAIADSIAAWDVLFIAGETPYDAPIRQRRRELEEMDDEIARRFPQAMAFVRPGFDEPEVASVTLTSAAPFEPRRQTVSQHQTVSQRIKGWLVQRFRR
jgi:hypothetical protein